MSNHAAPVEHTTTLAVEEKRKLVRSLRRLDMVFFVVCAIVGIDTLGQVSSFGAQTFTWVVVLAVAFLIPYALLMAELGSAFPQEGGPYEWTKLAFGRFWGGITAILYWVTNPFWVGGSLCFIATEAWSQNLHAIGSRSAGDYAFKLVFIWLSILVAIVSLRHGKWIPNAGAICRLALLGFFSVTVLIYAIEHGVHGYALGDFSPTGAVFIGLVPLLMFNYLGFELQNGAAEEMQDPQRDVPASVLMSGTIAAFAYSVPIFGILAVLPVSQVTGIGGFLDAVRVTFSVYGGASDVLLDIMALAAIFTLMTSGSVWMIGSDRVQAVAAMDGAFFPYFGVFSSRFGTPVRVNVLSGVTATIFMLVAQHYGAGTNATFVVVLDIAISTTLISYIWIYPAFIKLRLSHPDVHRPYRVPFGAAGMWAFGGLCTAWALLASWVAVFPDTVEHLFPDGAYDFRDVWGVSRLRFEAFTLGALGVMLVIAVIGYAAAGGVRARAVDVPLEPEARTT